MLRIIELDDLWPHFEVDIWTFSYKKCFLNVFQTRPGYTCWISFAPVFSFIYCWVLIFCFISLLYLDLYVLGDDALISYGSFMQTKYLCVLINIWIKGEVGAVKPV